MDYNRDYKTVIRYTQNNIRRLSRKSAYVRTYAWGVRTTNTSSVVPRREDFGDPSTIFWSGRASNRRLAVTNELK